MPQTSLSTLLTFPFKDPAWFKKLLILALVLLLASAIPVLPWILAAGYLARLIRRMIVEKSEPSLPTWDDLGGIFQDGWRPFAAALTYLLPVFALFLAGWTVIGLSNSFSPLLQMWNNDRNIDPREFLVIATSFFSLGSTTVAGFFGLIISFLLPAALIHAVVRQEYAAAFRFKEWWSVIVANPSGFLIAFAIAFGLNLVFGLISVFLFFTIILCFVLPFLSFAYSSYSYVVYAALFAEAYRVGADKADKASSPKMLPPTEPPSPGLEPVAQPEAEPSPEPAPERPPETEPEKPAHAEASQPTLLSEPILPVESPEELEPKPKVKPARKSSRKASADATLVQPVEPKSEIDTLPLPPPPPVLGVDTIVLPPTASVPGIDTLPLPPNSQGDQTSISLPQTGDKPG